MGKKLIPALLISPILYSGLLSTSMLSPVYAAEEAVVDASVITYEPDYFEKFSPVTLLDMLQRIPGVPEILNKNRRGRSQRGFGSGGDQILIDGRRLAGKSNNISDALSRISAGQVAAINLIRGATSGLDVQSQGLVINIIMREGSSKSSTFWKVTGEYTFGRTFIPQFLVSHTGSTGDLEYNVSLERKDDKGYRPSDEIIFNGLGDQTGTQNIDHVFLFKGFKFTSNLIYTFGGGDQLRLNGLFEPNTFEFHEERSETGDDADYVIWDQNRDNGRWEVGGDYTFNLGSFGKFKSLFVLNENTEDTEIARVRDFFDPAYTYANQFTDAKRSEKIFRVSTTVNVIGGQSIEIGGEAAINTFDKTFESFSRDNAIDPLALITIDDVGIQENRYELFAIHSYNISSNMVLQSSLTTELSKIVADNLFPDGSIDRRDTSFTYFKPRMDFRYDYTDSDQIRATVEKKVSQLRFDTFVTSFDAQNDELKVGNTNLRPTQIWEFALAYEHRLADDAGSLEGKIYYHHRKDHQTRVDFTDFMDASGNPIGADAFFALPPDDALRESTDFTSSQGNIDSAYLYGIDLKSNLRMGFVGVPEAVLTLGYRFEKRKSIDQFTQILRDFARHSDHNFNFNFRHDVTKWGVAYGFDISVRSDWANYDMRYFQPQSPSSGIKAFAEYNTKSGIKVRVDMLEISGSAGNQTTVRYADHIRFNEVSQTEVRENKRPRVLQLSLQGNF